MTSHATSERRVLGRYVLGPAIGRGATSVVHRAHDIVTGETVAVKVVPVELDLAPRVRAEVRAAGRLDHPRDRRACGTGARTASASTWSGTSSRGASLAELLRGSERLGDGAIVRIGEDVFAALAHAHERGVVHRDVKPANILIDHDGRAHLSDFGVARLSGESGLTMTGGVVGTVAYMSPEQARGAAGRAREPTSTRPALVVYEGLAGHNPVSASSPAETARRAAAGGVPPLASERPELPQDLCRAVDAGLRRDPRGAPLGRRARRRPQRGPRRRARRPAARRPGPAGGGLRGRRGGAGGRGHHHGPRTARGIDRPGLALAGPRRGRDRGLRRRLRVAPAGRRRWVRSSPAPPWWGSARRWSA